MMTDREELVELLKRICMEVSRICNDSRCLECPGGKDCIYGIYANLLIANGVTAQQWNSVDSEQKPVHGKEYFVRYTFGNSDLHFHGALRFCGNSENGLVNGPHFADEGWNGLRVTHWMEIPTVLEVPADNPSVSQEADSSLYTREPLGGTDMNNKEE